MTYPKTISDGDSENTHKLSDSKAGTPGNLNNTSPIFDSLKRTKSFYDSEFIRANFCPLKLSRSDIKNLSSDFPDQTLGGHRVYREELIDGKLAKVYEYKVKIIKYDSEYLKVEKKINNELVHPLIIIENNLIIPFNQSLAIQRTIDVSQDHPSNTFGATEQMPVKRGRPRKYPAGKEPYKKKKYPERNYEIIPEAENRIYKDDHPIKEFDAPSFAFSQDYYSRLHPPSPYTGEYYDFQANSPIKIAKSENPNSQNDIFKMDDHLGDFLSQQHTTKASMQKGNESSSEWGDSYSRDYF